MILRSLSAISISGDSPLPNHSHSRRLLFLFLFTVLLLTACVSQSQDLQEASRSYKAKKDYASLVVLVNHLHKGMARTEVEALLGQAEYSPIAGQEYYVSDRRKLIQKTGHEQLVGLIVEYRDEQGKVTTQLQQYWLGHLGE
jgi:hypothetical protein